VAIKTFTDEDGAVHHTDENSKTYAKYLKGLAAKSDPFVKEAPKLEASKPAAKAEVKSETKAP